MYPSEPKNCSSVEFLCITYLASFVTVFHLFIMSSLLSIA
jgi:hypothetical protein